MVRANPLTKRIDYLWVQVGKDESFEEIFELTTTGTSKPQEPAEQEPPMKKARHASPALPCAPSAGNTPSNDPERDTKKPAPKTTTTPDKKKEELKELNKSISKAIMDANKTKQRYHELVSSISGLQTSVRTQEEWNWLKNADSLLTPLVEAKDALTSGVSGFARTFIDLGIKDAKAGLEPNCLLDSLRAFKASLEPKLADAERQLIFAASHPLAYDS